MSGEKEKLWGSKETLRACGRIRNVRRLSFGFVLAKIIAVHDVGRAQTASVPRYTGCTRGVFQTWGFDFVGLVLRFVSLDFLPVTQPHDFSLVFFRRKSILIHASSMIARPPQYTRYS